MTNKTYTIIIAGTKFRTFDTREDAEKALEELKTTLLYRIHAKDTIWIKED